MGLLFNAFRSRLVHGGVTWLCGGIGTLQLQEAEVPAEYRKPEHLLAFAQRNQQQVVQSCARLASKIVPKDMHLPNHC